MGITIRKAEKKRRRLRMALIGISKSGKTYTALKFARALAGKDGIIGVVETEGGNGEIYQGDPEIGDFLVAQMPDNNPDNYIEAMTELVRAGAKALVIDSLSHAWMGRGGVLEVVDTAGGASKFTSGWGKATPLHNALIEHINHCPVHLIATMRQKAAYVLEPNAKGKAEPKKVGMEAVQRDGMEYEFDITALMSDSGTMYVDGIRGREMEPYLHKTTKKPGAKWINEIMALLDTSEVVAPPPPPPPPQQHQEPARREQPTPEPQPPRPAPTPPGPKQTMLSAIAEWAMLDRTDAKYIEHLTGAARRIYTHLQVPTNGSAADRDFAHVEAYVRKNIAAKVDFGEWAADPHAIDNPPPKLDESDAQDQAVEITQDDITF